MRVTRASYGVDSRGQSVDTIAITNDSGIALEIITYGGTITALRVPDRRGAIEDVVLGMDSLAAYEQQSAYFGAIIGRYANRIARGRFTLDGEVHQLATNEGPHHLHGGRRGFDRQVWQADTFRDGRAAGVRFSRTSPDGEEGYPGALAVVVQYTLDTRSSLTIDYEASTSAPTVVNLTQHSYFDLSAGRAADILDHVLRIDGRAFTPTDADLIPTGEIRPVSATPFDFTTPRRIGEMIDAADEQLRFGKGYDHNWVLDSLDVERFAARLHDAISGRTLTILTSEPGLQFYAGNRLNGIVGKGGRRYARHAGLCLECQHFPDSPSHAAFPTTVLRPGEVFRSRTIWRFGTDALTANW